MQIICLDICGLHTVSHPSIHNYGLFGKPWKTRSEMIVDCNFWAKYVNGNKKEKGIRIMHWNKGSSFLHNKINEIETVIEKYRPHILGLSEANFFSDHDRSAVQLPDYVLHLCPTLTNLDLAVSRVVVYTHSSLVVKPRPDLMNDRISAIWLEVGLPNKRKFLVCNFYREWGYLKQSNQVSHSKAAQLDRWKLLVEKWECALNENKEVVLLGDINIDSLKWYRDNLPVNDQIHKQRNMIELLQEKILPFGVYQQVSVPTHMESCLDHLYTNKPEKLCDVMALNNGGSDHKIISTVRYAKNIERSARYIRKRCFKKFDAEAFKADVSEVSWFDIYMEENVDEAVRKLTAKITAILDKWAPVRTIQLRQKYAPWLSDQTKELIVQRNLAQKIASISKDIVKLREYRLIRNRVTKLIRDDKKRWERAKLDFNTDDLWKNIKSRLNWKNSGPPTQLYYEGALVQRPKQLAKVMNSFFIKKVQDLVAKLPVPQEDPLQYLRKIMVDKTCSLTLRSVHPDEVLKVVRELKSSKATGLDHINMEIIKLILPDILPALTHIVNLSITTSVFPTEWKIAKVVPLLKKGDPLEPQNYRPVALLPIFSKILEKIVFRQIVDYVEDKEILLPSHHGSRAKHNTSTAILDMYGHWVDAIEEGKMAGIMMLDLSAAFDLVNHQLLLRKLAVMGMKEDVIKWFSSYLKDRRQCVYIDGQLSEVKSVKIGVPQGSVLGALLYVLFVNDLPIVIHDHAGKNSVLGNLESLDNCESCGALCSYVDDSTYTFSSFDPEVLGSKLSSQYRRLADYFRDNRLIINDAKTQLIVVGTRRQAHYRQMVVVDTGSVQIQPIPYGKLLGANIHETLKWRQHILGSDNSLIKSLTSRLNALRVKTKNASFKTRLTLANCHFMSIATYLMPVWGGAEKYLIKAVQTMQNKAARYVVNQSWYSPKRLLLKQCGWLSIRQLIFYSTALQVWKVLTFKTPSSLFARFKPSNTRSRTEKCLAIPLVETAIAKGSFEVRAALIWNRIPAEIRNLDSIDTFKRKLKSWISENVDLD